MQKLILCFFAFMVLPLLNYSQCDVGGIFIDAFVADPSGAGNNFDTDGDGVFNSRDEFVQICNSSAVAVSLNGYTLSDTALNSIALDGATIAPGQCLAVVSDWNEAVNPVPAGVFDANRSALWNNGGDNIILTQGANSCSVAYDDPAPVGGWGEEDGCASAGDLAGSGGPDCTILPSQIGGTPLSTGILPVELTSFTASIGNNDKVTLEWATASEEDNSHFEIQLSSDGISWITIGQVLGSGTSQVGKTYSFEHNTPIKGTNLYRLRQIDFGGKITFSKVVKAEFGNTLVVLSVDTQQIELFAPSNGELTYSIYNTNGQVVDFGREVTQKGNMSIEVNSNLSRGIYFVLMELNGERLVYKLIR